MKVVMSLLISVCVLCAPQVDAASLGKDNPLLQKSPFKTPTIIVYGDDKNYLIIDGPKRVRSDYTVTEIFTMKQVNHTITLSDEDNVIVINPKAGTAFIGENPANVCAKEYEKSPPSIQKIMRKNLDVYGAQMTGALGGTVKKMGCQHLEYSGDEASAMGVTTCTIRNSDVVLKVDASEMLGGLGNMIQDAGVNLTATKIIEDYKIPSGTFDVKTYTSVTPTPYPQAINPSNMVKGICERLKDPNLEQDLKRNMKFMPSPNQRFQTRGNSRLKDPGLESQRHESSLRALGDAGAGPDYVTEEDVRDHRERTQKAKEDMPDVQNQMNELLKAFGNIFGDQK